MDIPLIFAFLAIFGVIVYVLADGFDLGVGILFLFAPREVDRDLMMASIEPVWDGNETWLVFGGTFLFAAFPAAYYILLPAFYLPIIFMLFALIFRGIAFSFRSQAGRSAKSGILHLLAAPLLRLLRRAWYSVVLSARWTCRMAYFTAAHSVS